MSQQYSSPLLLRENADERPQQAIFRFRCSVASLIAKHAKWVTYFPGIEIKIKATHFFVSYIHFEWPHLLYQTGKPKVSFTVMPNKRDILQTCRWSFYSSQNIPLPPPIQFIFCVKNNLINETSHANMVSGSSGCIWCLMASIESEICL